MKTILDVPHDHHEPYPCRYCGAMAVKMDMKGVDPAGIRFLEEHYPNGFYIQSCDCIEKIVDKMDEDKYLARERAAITRDEWQQGAGEKKRRKHYKERSYD
jgi:hypothetical protein